MTLTQSQFPRIGLIITLLVCTAGFAEQIVPLSDLDLTKMTSGWGMPRVDLSVTGGPLLINGHPFTRGVGTHANSILHVKLDGKAQWFRASVGVDDAAGGRGSIRFRLLGDGKTLFDSGLITGKQDPVLMNVPLASVSHLILMVSSDTNGIDFDHANWAQAEFVIQGANPIALDLPIPKDDKVMLTPLPGPQPHINGPNRYGVRPGHPFLYRIPCTGTRPMTFSAEGLPDSLSLDPDTGIITGQAPLLQGEAVITLAARNPVGQDQKTFRLVVGNTLALTPPMGWNSWYIHYHRVTEQHMRDAARQMIASGMADFGYTYVNIDDCWMKKKNDTPYRDDQGAILPNAKFPDIQGMVHDIHTQGLKAGLYTSPGPWTCAGYVGSFQHETIDAAKFAQWGFDFLKYDWCSYGRVSGGNSLDAMQRPYQKMGDILKHLDRNILLNLCQYGMGDVWTWGGDVGGHCWRTTGDLGLEQGSLLPGFYRIGLSNAQHYDCAGPGRWNDPDYLLIGWVGDARNQSEGRSTPLTGQEQYSYMSLWSLMAAPLFFSGDMARLDPFTLNILCNTEVIEVDQDALGKQARPLLQDDSTLILAKPMEDGSIAVGVFNLSETPRDITVPFSLLALTGPQRIRDLWRQKELGEFQLTFPTSVARHGVTLIRLWPKN